MRRFLLVVGPDTIMAEGVKWSDGRVAYRPWREHAPAIASTLEELYLVNEILGRRLVWCDDGPEADG